MNVAFIGVGSMGAPMAACIARAGHVLTVYDSVRERAERVATEHGCQVARRLDGLAAADFVVTMLPTGQIVRDLYLREGLALKLSRGTIAIDMSSSDPVGTRDLGAALAASGITLIDAPVSGGVPRALQGTLTIMIGGDDPAAIDRARPLLAAMGDRLFDTGGLGSGHAMKALNNFVAAAGFAACAEALLAGQRFGLDPARMVEILNVSTGRSFLTDLVLREHVVDGRFATGFQLGLLAKDVRIAADLAHELRLDAPLVRLVSERFETARDVLGYTRDHTEAIKAWDQNLIGLTACPMALLAFSTGGVPYVWNDSIVFSPHACPFFRSASLHRMGFQSGARIRRRRWQSQRGCLRARTHIRRRFAEWRVCEDQFRCKRHFPGRHPPQAKLLPGC